MFGHQDEPKDQQLNETVGETLEAPSQSPSSNPHQTFSPSLPSNDQTGSSSSSVPLPPVGGKSSDQLLDIKQQALQQLTPLVGHLEQSPEEKFRTTMMMIQAADNQDLIKDAYEAAQAISDEKARAQALLDIVNEINYFTQHQGK